MIRPTKTTPPQNRRRGGVILEMSFCFPVLVILFLGCWRFGYTFQGYNDLVGAVRAGARFAAMRAYDSSNTTPSDQFLTAVRNVTVYGNPAGGTAPVVPGLTTANVALQVTFERNIPAAMTVSIVNFNFDAGIATFRFDGKPSCAMTYMGRYAPPA